jgi:hypothetical protein
MGKSTSLYFILQHLYVPSTHFVHVQLLRTRLLPQVIVGISEHPSHANAHTYHETKTSYANGQNGPRVIRDVCNCIFCKSKELET